MLRRGASHSCALTLSPAGEVLASVRCSSGMNACIDGVSSTADKIQRLLEQLLRSRPPTPVSSGPPSAALCVACSGVDDESVRSAMEEDLTSRLRTTCSHVNVVEDTVALLALLGGTGCVLVAGTGSVARRITASGVDVRCGGWGHVVSDFGSAYHIAVVAMSRMLRAMDGVPYEPHDRWEQLWLACCRCYEIGHRRELLGHLYGEASSKTHTAKFAEHVAEAARGGDSIARCAFELAGEELGALLRGVYSRTSSREESAEAEEFVCLSGTVLTKSFDLLRPALIRSLGSIRGKLTMVMPRVDAAVGAAVLAAALQGVRIPITGRDIFQTVHCSSESDDDPQQ